MGSYVFFTNQYLPIPGATGVCVHAIAKELVHKGHEVFTICYADNSKNTSEEIIDGVKVYRIPVARHIYRVSFLSKLEKMYCEVCSILSKLVHLPQYPLRSWKLIREYTKAFNRISKQMVGTITLIASYTPLEAVIAVSRIRLRYSDIKIVYYSADTLSNEQSHGGYISAEKREVLGQKWECELFDIYDMIVIMSCHIEHYKREIYRQFQRKIVEANFPLLYKRNSTRMNKTENTLTKKVVYAGTLYKIIRNPEFACNTLIAVSKQVDIDVVFLGGGDCEDLIKKKVNESSGVISYKGMVPYEEAQNCIDLCDVLISIGNLNSPMVPSKIYEYIATGKPIIHFKSDEKDACIDPLLTYGNAIIVDNPSFDIEKIADFIRKASCIPYERVEQAFRLSTPQYTAALIEEVQTE